MTSTTVAPEIQDFLAAVRVQLTDLDADEQREILDGLEADLADLVAEHGRGALGDPVAYARELRAAAGLEPPTGAARRRMSLSDGLHTYLDDVHEKWDRLVAGMPGDAPGLLDTMRPVWWVLRGWVAVQVAATWFGDWSLTLVPGGDVPGLAAVLVAVLLSIQLGRGRLWPADRWRRVAGLRVLLVGLNVFALVMIPVVLSGLQHGRSDRYQRGFELGFREGAQSMQSQLKSDKKAGLYADGTWVSNIYPYDAQGRPLVGVQLYNQIGKPINVITQPEYDTCDATGPNCPEGVPVDNDGNQLLRWYYPWTNGATQLLNVFPIPSRLQADEAPSATAFTAADPPTVGSFPLASVPKVSLPGITPTVQDLAVHE